jgi:hypothetical protein
MALTHLRLSFSPEPDPFAAYTHGTSSFVPFSDDGHDAMHAPPAPLEAPGAPLRRNRTSLLSSAGTALSAKFRRTKKKPPAPASPDTAAADTVVLDICARREEEEDAERERLRDAAAQSIGLVLETQSVIDAALDGRHSSLSLASPSFDGAHELEPLSAVHTGTSTSASYASSVPGRLRSGSLARSFTTVSASTTAANYSRSRARTSSSSGGGGSPPPPLVPPFPSTPAQLAPFAQLAAPLPKFHAGSPLLPAVLSKQWRPRHVVLSAPPALPSPHPSARGRGGGGGSSAPPAHAYLHVFKNAGPDERELERLLIDEDSLAFVADEEAGRRGVVKIVGVEAGAAAPGSRPSTAASGRLSARSSPDGDGSEAGRMGWLLQIADPVEAQRWVASVKSAVQAQRYASSFLWACVCIE